MTTASQPPFRADHVGSLLRPKFLLEARAAAAKGQISAVQLREVEDRAIENAIRLQEDVGLKSVTDGEFRRTYFHIDFLEQLGGVPSPSPPEEMRQRVEREVARWDRVARTKNIQPSN